MVFEVFQLLFATSPIWLPILLIVSLIYILNSHKKHLSSRTAALRPGGKETLATPEEIKRKRRGDIFTRAMFILWVAFFVLHRVLITALIAAAPGSHSNFQETAGMVIIFGDPWVSLPAFLLYLVLPHGFSHSGDAYLTYAYIAFSLLIDSLIIYQLWRLARHAFIAEKPQGR